jgi:hypothetical protein
MKSRALLVAALVFFFWTGASAQQNNRGDICQSIPGLTAEQQEKIKTLGDEHQQRMDALRTQFRSEPSMQEASNLKAQMNSEMQSHYNNICAVLTPDQMIWYNQTCNANVYGRAAYSRGGGRGPGCVAAYGRGTGFGKGSGNRTFRGRGRLVY